MSEQMVYCKSRTQLGCPSSEIHADLFMVTMLSNIVWVHRFKEGRASDSNYGLSSEI